MTLNLGNGNQSFVRDTPAYLGICISFSEISLDSAVFFLFFFSYYRYTICKGRTYDCDLDLGCGNINLVLDPLLIMLYHIVKLDFSCF